MKRLPLITILFLSTFFIMGSCKKDKVSGTPDSTDIPDLVFSGSVKKNGGLEKDISFTIPAQQPVTDYTIVSSHTSASKLMVISIQEVSKWVIGLNIDDVTSIKTDTYDLVGAIPSGYNDMISGEGGLATAGSLQLTKVDLFTGVTGVDIYYVNGNFTMTVEDYETPPNTYEIEGTFTGVNMTSN